MKSSKPLQPNAEALAQQLLLVSLALEQAVQTECWSEADALMQSRQDLIARLDGMPLGGRGLEIVNLVREFEGRLIAALQEGKRAIGNESAALMHAQRSVQSYMGA